MPKKLEKEEVSENVEDMIENIHEASKDIDEIQEDVDEIQGNVEEIQEDVKEIKKSLLGRVSARILPEEFAWDDLAQQIVGAIILSTPLAVTEEVWMLSQQLDIVRAATIIFITL